MSSCVRPIYQAATPRRSSVLLFLTLKRLTVVSEPEMSHNHPTGVTPLFDDVPAVRKARTATQDTSVPIRSTPSLFCIRFHCLPPTPRVYQTVHDSSGAYHHQLHCFSLVTLVSVLSFLPSVHQATLDDLVSHLGTLILLTTHLDCSILLHARSNRLHTSTLVHTRARNCTAILLGSDTLKSVSYIYRDDQCKRLLRIPRRAGIMIVHNHAIISAASCRAVRSPIFIRSRPKLSLIGFTEAQILRATDIAVILALIGPITSHSPSTSYSKTARPTSDSAPSSHNHNQFCHQSIR